VKGIVVDSAGNPIPYAYLSAATANSAVSSLEGRFSLRLNAVRDSLTITARRIGFRPVMDRVAFYPDAAQPVRLVMAALPATLATVEVRDDATGYDEYLDRSGYYRRTMKAITGTFISYDQIVKRNPSELTAMLSDVPGIHVERYYGKRGKGGYVMGRGRQCVLGLVVDGQLIETAGPTNEAVQARIPAIVNGARVPVTLSKAHGGDAYPSIDETVPVDMIAAIEIYPSAASVPNEFHHLTDACGLIVVWTRYAK